MAITTDLVEYILFDNLRYFHTSGKPVSRDTVFSDGLSDSKVAGSTPQSLFKDVSRHDIVINGGEDKAWPDNWLSLTSKTLAPRLV
jgi:hypothetical protein